MSSSREVIRSNHSSSRFSDRVIVLRETDFYHKTVKSLKVAFDWSDECCDESSINLITSLIIDHMRMNKKGKGYDNFLYCVCEWKKNGVIDCSMLDKNLVTYFQIKKFEEFLNRKFGG